MRPVSTAKTETRTSVIAATMRDRTTVACQEKCRNSKDPASEDPAPPFQGRIEPSELACIASIKEIEELGEDQKPQKHRSQKAGKGSSPVPPMVRRRQARSTAKRR